MDAAIITPDANPRKICCISALDCRFIKNTMAAPIVVIRKVNPSLRPPKAMPAVS